jgi:D-amino-acid dehydrogenase
VQLDDAESRAAAPWISLLDDRAKIVASRFGEGRFRIAGTAEFNGANRDIRADRIQPLVEWCEKHFPGVSTEHATP